MHLRVALVAGIVAMAVTSGAAFCADGKAAAVDAKRLSLGDPSGANWLSHGRNYREERYSPLKQISAKTIVDLSLAWFHDFDTDRGQESTPLVIDGVMYVSTAWGKVRAIDAATGKGVWEYDPEIPGREAIKACCDMINRGVAAWDGKIFVGTIDGRLIAIDAASGKQVWSVLTVDSTKPYSITGAPRVIKGKVLIGNAGAELGVRGYITAYDAATGSKAWRFYTIPGDPSVADGEASDKVLAEKAVKTWNGRWWELGGGGTVWDSMAYDADLDLLYIGTGNGGPWNQAIRSPGGGDNLFLSSIVALRPETGEYVWHYQEVPGDQWDYTATQQITLAELKIGGQSRQVLLHAPKNGFFYVIDRKTGELLSAEPFAPLNWATGIDLTTGRPNFVPEAFYGRSGERWPGKPGPLGAHNWQSMSFSPRTGLAYIPAQDVGGSYLTDKEFKARPLTLNIGIVRGGTSASDAADARAASKKSMSGFLLAWDPVRQKEAWRVNHTGPVNGGTLATAGDLVFQGTADTAFNAYDAASGKQLWSFPTQAGVVAAPISFSVKGRQYVSIVVGWGGGFAISSGESAAVPQPQAPNGRVLTFALKGDAKLPPLPPATKTANQKVVLAAPPATIDAGRTLFVRYCVNCHGSAAISTSVLPDLRQTPALKERETWHAIVGEGALESKGMVSFGREMTPAEIESIRAYVVSRANAD